MYVVWCFRFEYYSRGLVGDRVGLWLDTAPHDALDLMWSSVYPATYRSILLCRNSPLGPAPAPSFCRNNPPPPSLFVTPKRVLYNRQPQVMELEQRGKSAGTVAAERAEQVKELSARAETAELLAAERESQIKELEARALGAEADAREQAKQVCVYSNVCNRAPRHPSSGGFFCVDRT